MSDETTEKPKPGGVRGFFSAFKTKVWAGVLAILVGGSLSFGQDIASWIGGHIRAEVDALIVEIVDEKIEVALAGDGAIAVAFDAAIDDAVRNDGTPAEMGAIARAFNDRADAAIARRIDEALQEGGSIAVAVSDRIDDALAVRVGAVVGGDLTLTPEDRSQTLFFYLPANHEVEMNLDVRGLREGEIISLIAPGVLGQRAFEPIDRNGPASYSFGGFDRSESGTVDTNARDMVRRSDRRVTDDLVPLQVRLQLPQEALAASAAEGRALSLESKTTISFVALTTPPLRRVDVR